MKIQSNSKESAKRTWSFRSWRTLGLACVLGILAISLSGILLAQQNPPPDDPYEPDCEDSEEGDCDDCEDSCEAGTVDSGGLDDTDGNETGEAACTEEDDDNDDPGNSTFTGSQPGVINPEIPLGDLTGSDGELPQSLKDAVKLRFGDRYGNNPEYSSAAVRMKPGSKAQKFRVGNGPTGSLKQIVGNKILLNLEDLASGDGFEVKVYRFDTLPNTPSGPHSIAGMTHLRTITFQKPSSGADGDLLITQEEHSATRNSKTLLYEHTKNGTVVTWTLTEKIEIGGTFETYRVETLMRDTPIIGNIPPLGGYSYTQMRRKQEVDSSGTLATVSKVWEKWQLFIVRDTTRRRLKERVYYHTDDPSAALPANSAAATQPLPISNISKRVVLGYNEQTTNIKAYARVAQLDTYHLGSSTASESISYQYSGSGSSDVTETIRTIAGGMTEKINYHSYPPPAGIDRARYPQPGYKSKRLDNVIVSYETKSVYASGSDVVSKRTVYGGAGGTEQTSTYYHNATASTENRYRPRAVWRPDGTWTHYSYAIVNGKMETTTSTGTGDSTGVTDGIETLRKYSSKNVLIYERRKDIRSTLQLSLREVMSTDADGRPKKIRYDGNDDDYTEVGYNCCGIDTSRERSGLTTEYVYDGFGRKQFSTIRYDATNAGVPVLTTETILERLVTGGMSVKKVQFTGMPPGSAPSPSGVLVSDRHADAAGRTTFAYAPDADGDAGGSPEETKYTYGVLTDGKLITITTYPDLSTSITTRHGSGKIHEHNGTAVPGVRYTYGFTAPYRTSTTVTKLDGNGDTTSELQTTVVDPKGRTISIADGSGATTNYTYFTANSDLGLRGMVRRITDPDGVVREFRHRQENSGILRTRSGIPADGSGYEYSGGNDRISETERDVIIDAAAPSLGTVYRTRSYVYSKPIGPKTLVSTNYKSTDGEASRTEYYGSPSNPSEWKRDEGTYGDGVWTETSTGRDGVQTIHTYKDWRLEKTEVLDSGDAVVTSASYSYDHPAPVGNAPNLNGLGWLYKKTEKRNDTETLYTYFENGVISKSTVVDGKATGVDLVTTYTRDKMGRVTATQFPNSTTAYTEYTLAGQVSKQWGALTSPIAYLYDEQGRMTEMHTYPAHTGIGLFNSPPSPSTTSGDRTRWFYDDDTGRLIQKTDAKNKSIIYTYTDGGRLHTRKWARNITATYYYSLASGKTGDDGDPGDPTPGTADMLGDLMRVSYSDGVTPDVVYAYDRIGRLDSVTRDGDSHSYAYDPTTLVLDTETIVYDTNGIGTANFTRVLDHHVDDELRPKGWELNIGLTSEHSTSYGYDAAGRLQKVDPSYPMPNSPMFTYDYVGDSYGLVHTITGPAHTVTNTYADHRNVLLTKTNSAGASTRSAYSYGVNKIGQRETVATSGSAFTSVNTDGTITWDYDDYGQVVLASHDDGTTSQTHDRSYSYDTIGNRGQSADSSTLAGASLVDYTPNEINQYTDIDGPGGSDHPSGRSHDADGNLTVGALPADLDSNAVLVWDGENRLTRVTIGNSVTDYRYDYMGRRIRKSTDDGSTATTTHYIYDGWNLIAEYSGPTAPSITRRFLWGQDLSGSMQGAGGVGGLLASEHQNVVYYPTYDGNGNVSEYLNAGGTVVAHYEYDPFGRVTKSNGAKADDFPHRFSTKYLDDESGLYYYGYRYYDPVTGRWPSRDPIGERGGLNLYGFVRNNAVNWIDRLGWETVEGVGVGPHAPPGGGVKIPPGHKRPSAAEQRAVDALFEEHGCHTCGTDNPGTKSGKAVGDHQPSKAFSKVLGDPTELQGQCKPCSNSQGGKVSAAKRRGWIKAGLKITGVIGFLATPLTADAANRGANKWDRILDSESGYSECHTKCCCRFVGWKKTTYIKDNPGGMIPDPDAPWWTFTEIQTYNAPTIWDEYERDPSLDITYKKGADEDCSAPPLRTFP